MPVAPDPFSVICATPSVDEGNGQGDRHGSRPHQCCLFCHAALAGVLPDTSPAYTALDYPAASHLRWRHSAVAPRQVRPVFRHCPRDPPALT